MSSKGLVPKLDPDNQNAGIEEASEARAGKKGVDIAIKRYKGLCFLVAMF